MIQLFCALPCEAKPFIDHYQLKSLEHRPYPVYENHKTQLRLWVSGVGKLAMASALAYSYGKYGDSSVMANLNIGITGHARTEVGQGRLMLKVTDVATSQRYYPVPAFTVLSGEVGELKTVDVPEYAYEGDSYYDMEGAAFIATAIRFGSAEISHLYKVVSDNLEHSIEQVNKKMIEQLMAQQIKTIDRLVGELKSLVIQLADIQQVPQEYTALMQHWHCSHYQAQQLRRLLQRWEVLAPGESLLAVLMAKKLPNSQAMLKAIDTMVSQLPIRF